MSFGTSRVKTIALFFVALLYLIALSACQKKINSLDASQIHTESIKSANGFIISISKGGGVTGLTDGCTLVSTGIVQHWRQTPGKEKEILTTQRIRFDAAEIRSLFHEELLRTLLQSPGNMSKKLTFTDKDTTYTWIWDASETTDVVTPFNKIWDEIDDLCKTNNKN